MSWVKISTIAIVVLGLVVICLTFEVWAAAFLGLLFALSLNGPAKWIRSKWSMPAWTATVLVMVVVIGVMTGLGFVIGPPIAGQANEMARELPKAMDQSLEWLEEHEWGRSVVQKVESLSGMSTKELGSNDDLGPLNKDQSPIRKTDAAQQFLSDGSDKADADAKEEAKAEADASSAEHARSIILPILQSFVTMLSVTAWAVMLILISFVITLFIALNPEVYRRGIMWMIPGEHEEVATLTMKRISTTLRWWMLGRLASMIAVGLLTSLGMWIVGMPAPLALGALAGILSFVPNIGPLVAAVPGLLLAVPEGPWMLLSVVSVYFVAQLIESNLITPLVDQYTVTVPAAVLILAQVIMGVLGGAWGVVIATPLLVVVLVMTQQLYVREYIKKSIKVVGTDEDDAPDRSTENPHAGPQPQPAIT